MEKLRGTHGTSWSKAECIKDTGFKLGIGLFGRGVYFWRKGIFSEQLAIAWWKQRYKEGGFNADLRKECTVIDVTISVSEDEYLDIDEFETKETIFKKAFEKKVKPENKKEIASFFDLIFVELEKELQTKLKVIEARVPTPKKEYCSFYPLRFLGVPHCYSVFDPNCIDIIGIERKENESWS